MMSAPIAPELSAERMKATVATLASRELAGRRVASPGGAAARAWLEAEPTALDAVSEVDAFDTHLGAANLYATIVPATSGEPDTWLTAHYDGVDDIDGVHRPGASDNAVGRAVVACRCRPGCVVVVDSVAVGPGGSGVAGSDRAGGCR